MSILEESSFPRSAAPELPWVPGPDTSDMEPLPSFSQSGPPALASEWLGSFLVSFWRQKCLHTWSFLPREEPVPCLPVTRRCVALGDVLAEFPHPSGSPGRRAHCFPGRRLPGCVGGKPGSSRSQWGRRWGRGCPLTSPLHFRYKTSAPDAG